MANHIKLRRGTRAQLETAATNNELEQWEPGYITDDKKLIIATDTDEFKEINEVPAGGTTGQVLGKKSNTNFDTEWLDTSKDAVADAIVIRDTDAGITGSQIIANDSFVSPGQGNHITKKYLGGYETVLTASTVYKIIEGTFTANNQQITVSGQINLQGSAFVISNKFDISLRSTGGSGVTKSIRFSSEVTVMTTGSTFNIEAYEDPTTGYFCISIRTPALTTSCNWEFTLQDKANLNISTIVQTPTILDTNGLTLIPAFTGSPIGRSFTENITAPKVTAPEIEFSNQLVGTMGTGRARQFIGGYNTALATNSIYKIATITFTANSQHVIYIGDLMLSGNAFSYNVKFDISARTNTAGGVGKIIRYSTEYTTLGPSIITSLPEFQIYNDEATGVFYLALRTTSVAVQMNWDFTAYERNSLNNLVQTTAAEVLDTSGLKLVPPYTDSPGGRLFSESIVAPSISGRLFGTEDTFGNPVAIGSSNSPGVATTFARSDHVHEGSESENGLPQGGDEGQILAKKSNTDYDGQWITPELEYKVPSRIFGYTSDGKALRLWASSEGPGFEATQSDGVTKLEIQVQQVSETEIDGDIVNKTSNTGSAILPSGTSVQRDIVALPGQTRFNTTINDLEYIDNSGLWVPNKGDDSIGADVTGLSTAEFTNIPTWVNKIYISGANIQVPPDEQPIITFGHSDGYNNVAMASISAAAISSGNGVSLHSDGIYLRAPTSVVSFMRFHCLLLRSPIASNRDYWTISGNGLGQADSRIFWIIGQINFSNSGKPLTRLRFSTLTTMAGGTLMLRWEK